MPTDIMKAVIYNSTEKIEQLITNEEGEIDLELLDVRDNEGKTPLDIACILGKVDVIETLLTNGANIDSVSSQGKMIHQSNKSEIQCYIHTTHVPTQFNYTRQ